MRFKFSIQPFQTDAVESVADVFAAPQSQAAKVLLERVDWDA